MTTPEIVMWAVVGCIGLPAAYRNPTAAALSISWLVGQAYYLRTGDGLAVSQYFMADIAVVAIIYAKTIRRVGVKSYPTAWIHLKCFVLDLTVWDRLVVGLFLLGSWPTYVLGLSDWYKYWALYWLTVSQFALAGIEAAVTFYRKRKVVPDEHKPSADIIPFRRFIGAEPNPSTRPATLLARGDDGVRC